MAKAATGDPWYLLKFFACTKDEHDPSILYKKFPALVMYRFLFRVINESDITFIEKSRQIRLTWAVAILLLHDAMFLKNRRIADQSKKQDDANGILRRQVHIYRALIEHEEIFDLAGGFPRAKMTGENAIGTKSSLEFPENQSEILSIPQGDDVIPSHTWSIIFADEINLQPEFATGFGAALPALSGGGKFIGAGTPYGKQKPYYIMHNRDQYTDEIVGKNEVDSRTIQEKLVGPPKDVLENDPDFPDEAKRRWLENHFVNMKEAEFNHIPLHELAACLPGIEYWVNNKGYSCLRLHYTADPEKDPTTRAGKAWYTRERKRYARADWEQHQEINYTAYKGRPVVRNWERNLFVTNPTYDTTIPIRLSFDFGTTLCGCLFAQYVKIPNFTAYRLNLLNEVILKSSNTPELLHEVLEMLKNYYSPSWLNNRIFAYADPAGNQGRETNSDKNESTSIGILNAGGIFPDSRKHSVVETTQLIETVFELPLPDGKPAISIHERLTYFIECFSSGLVYPDKGKQGYYDQNECTHGGDIFRYMIANCFTQFDLAGKAQPNYARNQILRERFTGRPIGRRKSSRINPKRGEHATYS